MAKLTFPQSISRKNLAILVVIAGVILAAAVYLIYLGPAQKKLSATNASLKIAESNNAAAQAKYAATESLGPSAGVKIYTEAKALDTLLPQLCTTGFETSGCFNAQSFPLVTVYSLAGQAGMTVESSAPGVADSYHGVDYYQYTISVDGSFNQLVSFTKILTNSPSEPLITIPTVAATSTPKGVDASMTIDVWYANSLSQLPSTQVPAPTTAG